MNNEAKLGLFVIIVLGVFFLFTINIGSGLLSKAEDTYYIYFDTIGNMETGAPVSQAGYPIGEVTGRAFERVQNGTKTVTYVKVTIKVNEEARISEDSQAKIGVNGLMGEKYIDITFGTGPEAKPGTVINGTGPFELDRLMASAEQIMTEVEQAVVVLNNVIDDAELQNNIKTLVANLEEVSDNINELLGVEEENLKTIMNNAAIASENLKNTMATAELVMGDFHGLMQDSGDDLRTTLRNTREITDSLKGTLVDEMDTLSDDLKRFMAKLNETMDRGSALIASLSGTIDETQPDVREFTRNLRDISTNVKRSSKRVDEILDAVQTKPGLVNRVIYDEEMALETKNTVEEASNALRGLSEFPNRLSFETELRYFSDSNRFYPDEDTNMRADLGVRYAFNDYLQMRAGGSNIGTENTVDLQMAYTWDPITFRGGVIESEIGAGIEWQVFERWMLAVQGLGVTDDDRERVDILTELLLWDPVYLTGGVQDLTDEVYPYGGIKVRF